MHDPKMSTITTQAPRDSLGHTPLVGPDSVSKNRAEFGCSSSALLYRHQPLLHPMPIPLHHYLPLHQHQPHPFYFREKSELLTERSDRVPPLSPPIADTVPTTLPLPSQAPAFALTSSALEAVGSDLPFRSRVYGGAISSSFLLQHQHFSRLPVHLGTTRENERLLSRMPPPASSLEGSDSSRWASSIYDLDLAAAHYYRSLGAASEHHRLMQQAPSHVSFPQKDGPGFGLMSLSAGSMKALSPMLPPGAGYSFGRECLRVPPGPGGVLLPDVLPSHSNAMLHPGTTPSGVSDLPVSKSSSISSCVSRTMPTSSLSISLSLSSSSPFSSSASSASKRASTLASTSSCATATSTKKHTPLSSPHSSSSLSPSCCSKLSGRTVSRSPGLDLRRPSYSQLDSQLNLNRSDHLDYSHQLHSHRLASVSTTDAYPSMNPVVWSTRKHLSSQSDLDPLCSSSKRPALASSLSMPSGGGGGEGGRDNHLTDLHPPPALNMSDRSLHRFNSLRESPRPMDSKEEGTPGDKQSTPLASGFKPERYPSQPRSPATPETLSPVDSLRKSLHEHLLMSTHTNTERFELRPFEGSIVTGIPPARYASRCSTLRYDSHSTSNGGVSPPPGGGCREDRSSPGKDLPTRSLKQKRARDRQEVTSALDADREHAERLNNIKKCASTQTQFSSFMGESGAVVPPPPPPPPPPYYTTHDTIPHDTVLNGHHHNHNSHSSYPHPPPPLHHSYFPHSSSPPGASSGSLSTAASEHLSNSSHPHPSRGSSISSSSSSTMSSSTSSSPPSSSYHPPPPSAPSFTSHLRHPPHTSPSPPAGTTPSLPPAPPLVHAPMRSTPPPPPLPPYPGPPLPPPHYHADLSVGRAGADIQHAPLNLSLSNSATSAQSQHTSGGCRSPPGNKRSVKMSSSHQHRPPGSENGFGSPMSQEDESIEEHFRRSLGKRYPEPAAPAPPVSPPTPVQKSKQAALQPPLPAPCKPKPGVGDKICSVDDHFARALGDQMWMEIKARSEIASLDGLTDTVDAHFAKALGANMWKKLKEENKVVEDGLAHKQKQQPQQKSPSLVGAAHNGSKATPTPRSPVHTPLVT